MAKSSRNFLGKFLNKKIVALLLVIALIGGAIATFKYLGTLNNNKLAQAAPICPANYSWNGSTCVSNSPTSYDCTSVGGQAGGGGNNATQCFNYQQTDPGYSCPQGGDLSGVDCVGSWTNPVILDPMTPCPQYTGSGSFGGYPNQSVVSGYRLCFHYPNNSGIGGTGCAGSPIGGSLGPGFCFHTWQCGGGGCYGMIIAALTYYVPVAATSTPVNSWVYLGPATPIFATSGPTGYDIDINTTISNCTSNINNLNSGDTFNCTFNLSGSPTGTYAIPSQGLYAGIRETTGVEGSFLGNGSLCSVSGSILTCNNIPTNGSSIGSKEIVLHQPAVNWYPNKGTINIATKNYTPTNGQITNLNCTPTTQVVGNNVTCTGQATGAPSGFSYSGNVTVSIDNGGGNANTTLDASGAFSVSVGVGVSIGSKTATTNLGGSTTITVTNPILNTNIQSLSCTPTSVTVGGITNCTITLSGSTTFTNLTGSIDFKIGDSGTVKTCNIPTSGNTLTCTGVSVGNTATTLTSKFKASGTTSTFVNGNDITINLATTPLTPTDIPGLTVTCPTSAVNTTTTCTFPLPSNKTLPTDFKLTIGAGAINQTTGSAQSCTLATNTVTCTNVPTGNSVGIIPIYGQLTSTAGSKTATGESVSITGINFGKIDWVFNPDQGSTSPLFRSSDNTSITIKNLKTIFDLTPSSNTRYTCSLEYRNFNDRLITTPVWNKVTTTPVAYNTTIGSTQGCTFNLTKTQRANTLNHSLRLTITDTSITTPTTSNPNTFIFYNEYLFRFQGAGVASGG